MSSGFSCACRSYTARALKKARSDRSGVGGAVEISEAEDSIPHLIGDRWIILVVLNELKLVADQVLLDGALHLLRSAPVPRPTDVAD